MNKESLIIEAIEKKKTLSIMYDGGTRLVYPHALGELTNNRLTLSAYQVGGFSQSGNLPQWRSFPLENISNIQINDDHFEIAEGYNPNWKGFSKIISQV
jgi:hypothetical protein